MVRRICDNTAVGPAGDRSVATSGSNQSFRDAMDACENASAATNLSMSDNLSPRESFAKLMNRPVADKHQARILLVDDKQELLTSLHHLVTLYGYEADQALGGEAAMQMLQNRDVVGKCVVTMNGYNPGS